MRCMLALTPDSSPDSNSDGSSSSNQCYDNQWPFERRLSNVMAGSVFFSRLLDVAVDLRK